MRTYPLALASPLFLVLALLAGCDFADSSDAQDSSSEPLLPLSIGNEWIFEVTRTWAGDQKPPEVNRDTLRVVADTVVDGETWYEVVKSSFGTAYYLNRTDGVWRWGDPAGPESEPVLRYAFPAEAGTVVRHANSDGGTTSWRVTTADTLVSVPAGSFEAVGYSATVDSVDVGGTLYSNDYSSHSYLTPGTGFVKLVTSFISVACGAEATDEPRQRMCLAFTETAELVEVEVGDDGR